MAGRVLLAAVLSAVLMFVWGFVFWGVLNLGEQVMKPLPAELDVLASLRQSSAESGMYVYPMPSEEKDDDAKLIFETKHLEGPILQMAYVAEGGPVMPPERFAQGLGHYFAVALLTGCLLALAARGLPSFGSRVMFVLLLSLIAAVWGNVGDAVWWFHSREYCLANMAYTMGAGLAMALVMASIVRRDAEDSEA